MKYFRTNDVVAQNVGDGFFNTLRFFALEISRYVSRMWFRSLAALYAIVELNEFISV